MLQPGALDLRQRPLNGLARGSPHMEELDDAHRAFLSILMSRKTLTEKEARQVLERIDATLALPEGSVETNLKDVVSALNSNLVPLGMQVSDTTTLKGVKSFAVVDKGKDEHCKLATYFTQPELEIYMKIVEGVIQSDTNTVSETHCVNLRNEIQGGKMTVREVEALLERLVSQKWLSRGQGAGGGDDDDEGDQGGLTLGVRSQIDLKDYLAGEVDIPGAPAIERVDIEGALGLGCAQVFIRPANEGGTVTGYVLTVSGGPPGMGAKTFRGAAAKGWVKAEGLPGGTYTFTVKALNLGGASGPSGPSDRCDLTGDDSAHAEEEEEQEQEQVTRARGGRGARGSGGKKRRRR